MPKQKTASEQKTAYQRWYERNKDSLNLIRRKKYHEDPEYRDQVRRLSGVAKKAKPFVSKAGLSRVRPVGGVFQMTYPMREVASFVGRSVQTLRLWESNGWIPAPTVNAGKRFYTAAQKELLQELASIIDSRGSIPPEEYSAAFDRTVESIKSRWSIT